MAGREREETICSDTVGARAIIVYHVFQHGLRLADCNSLEDTPWFFLQGNTSIRNCKHKPIWNRTWPGPAKLQPNPNVLRQEAKISKHTAGKPRRPNFSKCIRVTMRYDSLHSGLPWRKKEEAKARQEGSHAGNHAPSACKGRMQRSSETLDTDE